MRATIEEGHILTGVFAPGSTVTIDIVQLPENVLVVEGGACIESLISGIFYYQPSLNPVSYTQYAYKMRDGNGDESVGVLDLGGYPDTLLSRVPIRGAGAIPWTYTLTRSDTGVPIADAEIWVTSDLAGANIIASGLTDQNGQVEFMLDAGTVYVWRAKSGFNFVNPDTEEVIS